LKREEAKRRQVETDNERLSEELGMEKGTNERLRRQHAKAKGKLAQARADLRMVREERGSLQAEQTVAKAGLEASRVAREGEKATIAKQGERIANLSQSADLRRLLRGAQKENERLERANQFLRGEKHDLASERDNMREENNTVKEQVDRLRAENRVLSAGEARRRREGSLGSINRAGEANM
jgi:chromosome segregation ATPase